MTDDQWISIIDFLQSKTGFHNQNFTIIREQYRQQCGGSFPEPCNESAVKEVARQLKIKIDTTESLELLRDCVISSSEEDSRTVVKGTWNDITGHQNVVTVNGPVFNHSTTTTNGTTKHFLRSIAQLTFLMRNYQLFIH